MRVKQNIPWPQLTVEAIAIVVSILLAFWIDAWWEARTERAVERQYLESILADIDAVLAEVDRTTLNNEDLNEKARLRMVALREGRELTEASIAEINRTAFSKIVSLREGEGLSPSAVTQILEETSVSYRLRANLDTYTDLLNAAGVLAIRDPGVRRSLAKLRSEMDFEYEVFKWTVEFGHQIAPLLHESIDDNALEKIATIEEQVVIIRKNHNRRKGDVLRSATEARNKVMLALENF